MNYKHFSPTKIIMGSNTVREEADQLAKLGWHAFVISGEKSAGLNGALTDVIRALEEKAVAITCYDKILPNPTIESVRQAAAHAREKHCDFVVAVGGGSVIDAAKAVAVLCYNKLTDEELFGNKSFEDVLPVAAVPTTAGSGSEVTPYSILTNLKLETKCNLKSEQLFPAVAFLDARYTMSLTPEITSATVMDAMSHAIEGYLAARSTPIGRILALESLKLIGNNLSEVAEKAGLDIEARQELLYASTLAGMVIAQSGTTVVHALGYALTFFKQVEHGRANGLLLPAYLEFINQSRSEEVSVIMQALGMSDMESFEKTVNSILEPVRLSEDEKERFAVKAMQAGNLTNTNPVPRQVDIEKIILKNI